MARKSICSGQEYKDAVAQAHKEVWADPILSTSDQGREIITEQAFVAGASFALKQMEPANV